MNCRRRSLSAMWETPSPFTEYGIKGGGEGSSMGHRRHSQAQSRMHYGR
jgi:hypothetical protein